MTVAVPRLRHFIGGTWTESRGDRWIHDVNPSDSTDVIAHVPEGVADDVASAVNAASHALDGWRSLSGPARAEHLYKWAAVIGELHEALAQIVTR